MTMIEKETTTSPTAKLFAAMINRHTEFQQKEIAQMAGIKSKGNILSLFKSGNSKIPVEHIPTICRILNEDPQPLLESAFQEYHPQMLEAISLFKLGQTEEHS